MIDAGRKTVYALYTNCPDSMHKGDTMTFLRVMTLNNFNSVPPDEIECFSDVWANRAAFNVATLKRYDPDIIGLAGV